MGRASDAREVLITEALGDFVKLLDRIDAVQPMLEKTCRDLRETADKLMGNIEPFQKRIVGMAIQTQDRTLEHMVKQANLAVQHSVADEVRAMQESARKIFNDEVEPSLKRIAGELRAANLRTAPRWKTWLTHAAAAIGAASCTSVLMLYFAPPIAIETQPATIGQYRGPMAAPQPALKARDRR